MAGGKVENDPEILAKHCEALAIGTQLRYVADGTGDMWLFELFHHLNDCATAFRKVIADGKRSKP